MTNLVEEVSESEVLLMNLRLSMVALETAQKMLEDLKTLVDEKRAEVDSARDELLTYMENNGHEKLNDGTLLCELRQDRSIPLRVRRIDGK